MGMAVILVKWPGPFEQTFIPPSHGGSTWNLASIGLAVSQEKKFENFESEWSWSKVNECPWPLRIVYSFCVFDIIDYNSFWNIHCFTFFPYKSIREQIWPCCIIGQGQTRVIIWINLVVLVHLMLHTKFEGHQPFGFREEDFFKVFTIYGHDSHLGNVTWIVWTNFCSPIP